jgi:hypothetical protein
LASAGFIRCHEGDEDDEEDDDEDDDDDDGRLVLITGVTMGCSRFVFIELLGVEAACGKRGGANSWA